MMVPTMSSVRPRGACEPWRRSPVTCSHPHTREQPAAHRKEATQTLEVDERATAVDGQDLSPDIAVLGLGALRSASSSKTTEKASRQIIITNT
jgi:hypothetical protein